MVGRSERTIGLSSHVDTLGLMVRSIKDDGTLSFINVGAPIVPTLDGEYWRIITRNNTIYTDTILSDYASMHVHEKASTAARKCENMHVRLDAIVKNKKDVQALGITNGDYIAIDPKTTITDTGFIKSRFLDDKIYPYYASDTSAALRGGNDIKGALIGPGVHASHDMERTHYQALENTVKLIISYLKDWDIHLS